MLYSHARSDLSSEVVINLRSESTKVMVFTVFHQPVSMEEERLRNLLTRPKMVVVFLRHLS